MPISKPVSELRNYPEVLKEVKAGVPVYLTKNGTGRYVLMDIADYANVEAAERLNYELMRGRLALAARGGARPRRPCHIFLPNNKGRRTLCAALRISFRSARKHFSKP